MGVKKDMSARIVFIYLIVWLISIGYIWSIEMMGLLPGWLSDSNLPLQCSLIGALGGVTYCLRAIYLNKSVRGQWNKQWVVWYYLRPFTSTIVGGVSYIFLKAGLLALDANAAEEPSPYGYLALAYIAGLNVDRFIIRIEEIAKSNWGIRPSRTSEDSSENKDQNK